MKLPGWMASVVTGFITATLQLGVRPTVVLAPLSPFTVIELAANAVTTPRTTLGAAGAWAQAVPAASVIATAAVAIFSMRDPPLERALEDEPCAQGDEAEPYRVV